MIKIIKKGKLDILEFECKFCGCKFKSDEYSKSPYSEMAVFNRVMLKSVIDICPNCKGCVNKDINNK